MKRMIIERYVPPVPRETSDGLPPLPPLPPRDGVYTWSFIGRRTTADAWGSETVQKYARGYARTCMVAHNMELDVLRAERDALKARLDELQQP